MRKTLRNIVLCSALAIGSLFIGGCNVKVQRNVQNNYNISNSALEKSAGRTQAGEDSEDEPIKSGIEKYFLQGKENPLPEKSGMKIYDNNDESGDNDGYPFGMSIGVLRGGFGAYIIPKIEEDSEERKLVLEVIEFESPGAKESYINDQSKIAYPLFIEDNTISMLELPTKDAESLSPKQKEIYANIIRDYINRTGAEVIMNREEAKQRGLLEHEAFIGYAGMEEDLAQADISKSKSAPEKVPKVNITNEPANITKSGLENYFFQGDELKFLELSSPYEFEADLPNPCIIDSKNPILSEKERESFKTNKILRKGIGEYTLEDIESYSRPRNLILEIVQFESESDKKNFIKEELGEEPCYFDKGKILSVITPSIHNLSDNFSQAQKVTYIDLIKNYSKRTGLDMILYENETRNRELLGYMDKFVEKFYLEKGIPQE